MKWNRHFGVVKQGNKCSMKVSGQEMVGCAAIGCC